MAQISPFQIFGLKPSFAIDEDRLEQFYQAAMKKVHPDLFADRSAAERRVAEQWSSRINEAHELLKNPVERASWLCEAAGFPIGAETNTAMPIDFLMKQMQWREELENAQGNPEVIDRLREETVAEHEKMIAGLADAIDVRADWKAAVDLTRRLMFVVKFLRETERVTER